MSSKEDKTVKPTLVVGATGQVGRLCVAQLLEQNKPVRALVRNIEKAKQVFGDADLLGNSNLQIIVADLSEYQEQTSVLEQAVQGCDCIISVSGALRFSKLMDFLPWRLMNPDVSAWADRSHPYYCNYQAHCLLIDLAKQYKVKCFVRLTGGTVGFSAFNPFVILMSSLLSMTTRYHFLTENYLRESNVPYMIVRPGGLMNGHRDPSTTFVQVDPTCRIPPPSYVHRADVAALCVAACSSSSSTSSSPSSTESYTMCIRAVGEAKGKNKRQGTKTDGHATVQECLDNLLKGGGVESANGGAIVLVVPKTKPYGLAVGLVVYTFMGVTLGMTGLIVSKVSRMFL